MTALTWWQFISSLHIHRNVYRNIHRSPMALAIQGVLCLLIVSISRGAHADAFQIVSCGTALKFYLPSDWQESSMQFSSAQFSSVQCAYFKPGSGFPNINVVAEPSPKHQMRLESEEIQAIIESYRSVGLLDPKFVKTFKTPTLAGASAFGAIIDYENNGTAMTTALEIIEYGEVRYSITFMDHRVAFRHSAADALKILGTVELIPQPFPAASSSNHLAESKPSPPNGSAFLSIFSIILGVLLGSLALLALLRGIRR